MENQPKAGVTLPPGFWSQPSSDQLERIEALLQRFLSLPGIQNEAEVRSSAVSPAGEEMKTSHGSSTAPTRDWSPSGSTWGPLAEAWKSVQGKGGIGEGARPELDRRERNSNQQTNPVPSKKNPEPTVTDQTVIPWNFQPEIQGAQSLHGPRETNPFTFPVGNPISGLVNDQPKQDVLPPSDTSPRSGSQPEKPGWIYSSLALTNRLFDACLIQFGSPGKIMASGLGKWALGLAGLVLLGCGSWLYMREAIEEIWGQMRLGSPITR